MLNVVPISRVTVKTVLAGCWASCAELDWVGQIGMQQQYDEKNIRRRVYDALNVLMAMDIISKEKKEIQWKGLPSTSVNNLEQLKVWTVPFLADYLVSDPIFLCLQFFISGRSFGLGFGPISSVIDLPNFV